ncbi:hypothetical protein DFP72DRAFT_858996 [Ephemerocybe angulata]|uniref:Ribonuclease H1 N-terminal domain-containing protein n=1 Tax=Ephemerocybe angulata TaxID=980116 RepID=A0A8H6HBW8_9AGAR|nr:hypothetical protein DFP72DRAFT_858996 [Tulosesus angulatus]
MQQSTITLTALIDALAKVGVKVSSPHQEMLAASTNDAPPPPPPSGAAVRVEVPASGPEAPISTTRTPPTAFNSTLMAALVTALQGMGIEVAAPSITSAAAPPANPALLSASIPEVPISAVPVATAVASTPSSSSTAPSSSSTKDKGKAPETPAAVSARDNVSGYVCNNCSHYNLVVSAKGTWYVITAGREVGVFSGWHNVQPLVSGVSSACYKKWPSEAAARAVFQEALDAKTVVVIQ